MMRVAHKNPLEPFVKALCLALVLGPFALACDADDTAATTGNDPEFDEDLENPFNKKNHDAVEAGRELYAEFCSGCHNYDGKGRGPDAEGLDTTPPNLVDSKAAGRADGWFFSRIWQGFDDSPMKGFSKVLDDEEACWQIVTYLRTLQG